MSAPTLEHMAYVAYCHVCGGMVAAVVDDPNHQRDNSKEVARWMREGSRVERVTCQHVRDNLKGCTAECACFWCEKKRRKLSRAASAAQHGSWE